MQKILFLSFCALLLGYVFLQPKKTHAQVPDTGIITNIKEETLELLDSIDATDSAIATESAEATTSTKLASPSAEVEEKIKEQKDKDLTETSGEKKSKLAAFLDENPISPPTWNNMLQHAIRKSIENGLPANVIVLLILFPVIAAIISASRHIVGLKGFGIYTPAVLSVAFVSTGIFSGIFIFISVLLAAVLSRKLTRRLKLPYLPRTAMLLWGVSLLVLLLLVSAALLDMYTVLTISIFPLLIIMLLTENFMETQLFTSQKEALRLTLETLFIAIICSIVIGIEQIQQFVLLKPELTFIMVAIANFAIGKYTGLRLLEYIRFKPILEKEI